MNHGLDAQLLKLGKLNYLFLKFFWSHFIRNNLFGNNIDIAGFRFDDYVVKVFDDMVRRSVPEYDSMIQMVGLIARMYC